MDDLVVEIASDAVDAAPDSAADPAPSEQEGQGEQDAASVSEIVLSDAQYQAFSDGIRSLTTVAFVGVVLGALILGTVLYGHFVRGWRS